MYGGPRLYRFYNYEQQHYIPAPTGGWNPDVMPWELPPEQAPQLDNFLIRPGKIIVRGGFQTWLGISAATRINLCGAVGGNPSWWLLQSRATAAGNVVDPWSAPLIGAIAAQLAQPTATATWSNQNNVPASPAVTKDQAPGPRWINFDGMLYGISYGASTAPTTLTDVNSNYTTTATNLLTLPMTQAAATAPTAHPVAPRGAFDLKGYQSRIWLLAGADTPGGATAHRSTALFFTNPGASGIGTAAADWKDPVSGLTNLIVMDNDTTDFGVGLAVVRSGMIIFRRSSTWLLRGSTTANYQLIPLSRDVGCIDARTIVETTDGVYWLSSHGLMFSSGSTVQNVSGSVLYTLRDAIQAQQSTISINGGFAPGFATCVLSSQGQIIMSMGYHDPNQGDYRTYFAAMFDTATKTWTRMTSNIWSTLTGDSVTNPAAGHAYSMNTYPGPLVSRQTPRQILAIGDKYATMLEDLYVGYSFNAADGENQTGGPGILLFDVYTGATNVPFIPATWRTSLVPVISTSRRRLGQARRVYMDYRFSADQGSAPINNGFTVTPVDVNSNQLGSQRLITPAVPVATIGGWITNYSIQENSGATATEIMRQHQDWSYEINQDMGFMVQWLGDGQTHTAAYRGAHAQVFGVGLEFQSTRDAR